MNLLRTGLKLIQIAVPFIDFVTPKDDKIIVFGSNGGEYKAGSPSALYDYAKSKEPEYRVYYYLPFEGSKTRMESLVYIVKFAPIFFKAKYLVSSHPPSDFFPFYWWSRRKKLVNVWHGVGPKSIFFADTDVARNDLRAVMELGQKTYALVVSSKLEAALFSRIFYIDPRKFRFTGQPRNDLLMRKGMPIKEFYGIDSSLQGCRRILYCPTYRRGAPTHFFPFADFDRDEFERFLKDNNAIMLIRGHPYEQANIDCLVGKRIHNLSFEKCNDVNSVLGYIDVLVTDYSSLYIDFLLTDKPLVFIPYDLEEYESKRSLLFDNYELWAPGKKVNTLAGFLDALKDALDGRDEYKRKRNELRIQFHHYQLENSSQRVFDIIKENQRGNSSRPGKEVSSCLPK